MSFNFNLLISTPRNFERDALAELDFIIHQLYPESHFNYGKTIVKGLVWGNIIDEDPILVTRNIKAFVMDEGFELQFLLKVVPIQAVVETNVDVIKAHVMDNLDSIAVDEKYKIVLRKRRIALSSSELIEKIAENITRKVDLDNPDKIIRLEIIGKYTGISLLKKGEVFSLGKKIF
ncbi:MAG: THUMP domain-containing protein [Promethearchaeota archaeon]